jgi:hypothetical protein
MTPSNMPCETPNMLSTLGVVTAGLRPSVAWTGRGEHYCRPHFWVPVFGLTGISKRNLINASK